MSTTISLGTPSENPWNTLKQQLKHELSNVPTSTSTATNASDPRAQGVYAQLDLAIQNMQDIHEQYKEVQRRQQQIQGLRLVPPTHVLLE